MIGRTQPVGTGARRGAMLAVLLAGQVMVSMDGSIVSVAAQTIRAGLQASDAEIQLLVSGYLLTTGVLFVTCARLGDLVGHRRVFLLGLGGFTAASLLCGSAPDATVLVLARVAQAVGAALLMPQVFALIHRLWHGVERHRAIGVYSMVLALGVALGQLIGGLVAGVDLFGLSWRPVFLINVPVGVVALCVAARVLPRTRGDMTGRLDVVGVLMLSAAMTALTLPVVLGREHGWPPWTWSTPVGGVVLLAVFVRYEARARHPIVDVAALRPRGVAPGLAACCVVMGSYTVFVLALTLHLQSTLGFTPPEAGLAFVPYAVGFGAVSLTWHRCPWLLQRVMPVVGPLVLALGVVLVAVLAGSPDGSPWATPPLLLLAGAGHAAAYSPLIAHVTSLVPVRSASAIAALNATGPVLTEVIGVAALGSLYFAAPDTATGLMLVGAAVAALLIVAAVCAARSTVAEVHGPHTTQGPVPSKETEP